MKSISRLLVGILVVSLIGIIWLLSTGQVEDVYTVTYKTVLQLFVIAVFGHIVSLLMNKMDYEREELKAKDEFRKVVLSKLNDSFFEIKKIRRLVRAKNIPQGGGYPKSIIEINYYESMEVINNVQLQLEGISKEIKSNETLFHNYDLLQKDVDSLEEYLNVIVDEFEHTSFEVTGDPPRIAIEDLPKFNDLIQSYRRSNFRTDFVKCYYKSTELIRATLLYSGENVAYQKSNSKKQKE